VRLLLLYPTIIYFVGISHMYVCMVVWFLQRHREKLAK
jgi:hypothetical protein